MNRPTLALLVFIVAVDANPLKPSNGTGYLCETCKMSVLLVLPSLKEDLRKLEDVFVKGCEKFLERFPWAQKECDLLVKEELNGILDFLSCLEAPEVICKKLHAC
ncbi:hypothetical protein RB195_025668 [Necator americanus]|uniref:Saposin B-type domain-containing protein n=1 Tax=Necator americanus TaxID=51031 RepID=A0ABR1ETY8_NECAM